MNTFLSLFTQNGAGRRAAGCCVLGLVLVLLCAGQGHSAPRSKNATKPVEKKLLKISASEKKKFSAFADPTMPTAPSPLMKRPQHDKAAEKPLFLATAVEFSGGKNTKAPSPHRAPLPGAANVLPEYGEDAPKEVAMKYKMHNGTSAKFVVNQQDESSPLFTPLDTKSGKVASTGVGLDVEVEKNMKILLGAERKTVEGAGMNSGSSSSQGASVGVSLSF